MASWLLLSLCLACTSVTPEADDREVQPLRETKEKRAHGLVCHFPHRHASADRSSVGEFSGKRSHHFPDTATSRVPAFGDPWNPTIAVFQVHPFFF